MLMPKNRFSSIFIPGGMPTFTYNPRTELDLEGRLREAFLDDNKLITLTGLTKTGKTVLAKKIFPKSECIWFDGGMYNIESDFWEYFLEKLDLYNTKQEDKNDAIGSELAVSASVESPIPLLRAKLGLGAKITSNIARRSGRSRSVSAKILVLDELTNNPRPVVIDDFHYIPKEEQGKIIRAFKGLIFEGIPIVIIAIPHRRYDAERVEREMEGRINSIQLPSWSIEELSAIGEKGFPLLNMNVSEDGIKKLAAESFGRPHLMQEYCKSFCKDNHIVEQLDSVVDFSILSEEAIFNDVAANYGRPVFEKLKRGPRIRTDRVKRKLKNGRSADLYELLLAALVNIKPGICSITYEEIKTSIREIIDDRLPQVNEVSRVMQYMMKISTDDSSSSPVIDWDKKDKILHVIDPYFAFFLKWTKD